MYALNVSSSSTPISTNRKISENLQQAMHGNEKSRGLPDFFGDQGSQVQGGKHHHHDEHSGQHEDGELLDLSEQRIQHRLPAPIARPFARKYIPKSPPEVKLSPQDKAARRNGGDEKSW